VADVISVSLANSPNLTEATDCIEKARKYANKRNDVLHQAWGLHDGNDRIAQRRLPFTEKHPPRSVSVTEIENDIYNVRMLAGRLFALIDALEEKSEPLPTSHGRQPIPRAAEVKESTSPQEAAPQEQPPPLLSSSE
jgi:hypothetical protein